MKVTYTKCTLMKFRIYDDVLMAYQDFVELFGESDTGSEFEEFQW